MAVGTFIQPDFTAQDATSYKTNIDNSIAVTGAVAARFAVTENSPADMTVSVASGFLPARGSVPIAVGAQVSATVSAPVANPRFDIISISTVDGALTVTAGAENATPQDPAVPAENIALARLRLSVAQAAISNQDIDDLRGPLTALKSMDNTEATAAVSTLPRSIDSVTLKNAINTHAPLPDLSNATDPLARANIMNLIMQDVFSTSANDTNLVNGFIEKAVNLTLAAGNFSASTGTVQSKYYTSTAVDAVPTMAAATNGAVTVAESSVYSASYPAWSLFNDTGGTWISSGDNSLPQWVSVDFGAVTAVYKWRIKSYSTTTYNPTNFKLQGSNDNASWSDIVTVTAAGWAAATWYEYLIKESYQYYRMYVTATEGATRVSLLEMELIGANAVLGNLDAESSLHTALSAPTSADIYALFDRGSSADIQLKLSTDNGVSYTSGTNLVKLDDIGGLALWRASVDLSGNAGTQIKAKTVTLNNVDIELHDIGIMWN